jgi:hypothetical protein
MHCELDGCTKPLQYIFGVIPTATAAIIAIFILYLIFKPYLLTADLTSITTTKRKMDLYFGLVTHNLYSPKMTKFCLFICITMFNVYLVA